MPPIIGLTIVSAIVGVGMLFIFKLTSNQDGIDAIKRKIHASLFEIRLFNDDILALFRAQLDILRHNLVYLRYSLVPMVWMMIPVVLVIAQLQFLYGYTGFKPGDETTLKVQLAAAPSGGRPDVRLDVPPGLELETPAVWVPALREMAWRLKVTDWGEHDLKVSLGDQSWTKTVTASQTVTRRSPERLEAGFVNQLIYPAEDPLPKNGPVRAISLVYPDSKVGVMGWGTHWMIVFFVLSIVFGFALRKPLGVKI